MVLPVSITDSKTLSISEIRNVENWREKIPAIAQALASHPFENVIIRGNEDLEEPKVINAVIQNPHVKRVIFRSCEVDSNTLSRIFHVQNLEALELEETTFVDEDAVARILQSGTRRLEEVCCFFLEGRSDCDAVAIAVAKSLRYRTSLKKLTIYDGFDGQILSASGLGAIGEALQHYSSLESIDIASSTLDLSEETIAKLALAIERNSSLKEFSLEVDAQRISPTSSLSLLQSLTRNSSLEKVELKGLSADIDLPTAVVGENRSLKHLTLGGFAVTEVDSYPRLSPAGTLTKALVPFRSLVSLDLACWEFNTEAIEVFCDALGRIKTLERLELYGVMFDAESTSKLFRFISENLSLHELSLVDIEWDDEDLPALCNAVKQNATIRALKFTLCQISNLGIRHIAGLLQGNDVLENLSFVMTEIRNEGLFCLGNALKRNTALKQVLIQDSIGLSADEEGLQSLIHGHAHHRKVQLEIIENTPRNDMQTQSQKDEIFFYNERNGKLWPLLNADPPLALWPKALQCASQYRTPDMLYFLVKEKCDLFKRSINRRGKPTAGKRKRAGDQSSSRAGRRTRQRTKGN